LLQQINQFVNIKHEDHEQNGITKNMEEEEDEKHERLSLQNIGVFFLFFNEFKSKFFCRNW